MAGIDPNDLLKRIREAGGGDKKEEPKKEDASKSGPTINVGKAAEVGKGIVNGASKIKETAIDDVREGYTRGVESVEKVKGYFWEKSWVGRFMRFCKKTWKATSAKEYNGKYAKFAEPVAEDASAGDRAKHKMGKFMLACARGLRRVARVALVASLAATGINLWPASIGGDHVRDYTTEPVYDATRMGVFGIKTDTLYLNSFSEVDSENEIFTVRGSTSATVGNDTTTIMMKVQPRIAHNIYNFTQGKGVFMPDREVNSIVPGGNYPYKVTYYGSRWTLARTFGLRAYPDILSIERLDPATVPGAKPRAATEATKEVSDAAAAFLKASSQTEKNDNKENVVSAQALAAIRIKPGATGTGM